ncbi:MULTISPECIES: hypothetical protein [Enterobacter]|uniref:hypothetical protein n=1 Tax=Enterobacter TaxID=547 RepID=UPI000C9A3EDE|nr:MULTISPECIES: hypothetical protein [Enterobacter]MCM7272256.1 hypothetical protein [Enterobacter hormaechei]HCU0777661.1 hypothetical protein [Enterobacter hormaechei]
MDSTKNGEKDELDLIMVRMMDPSFPVYIKENDIVVFPIEPNVYRFSSVEDAEEQGYHVKDMEHYDTLSIKEKKNYNLFDVSSGELKSRIYDIK